MKLIQKVLFASCILVILSCGGGGGGSSQAVQIPGGYIVTVSLSKNTCPSIPSNNRAEGFFEVNQSGNQVVVSVTPDFGYTGTVTANDSFRATRTEQKNCRPSGTSQEVDTLEFSGITSDSAFVTVTQDFSRCSGDDSGASACQIIYVGSADRIK